MNCDKLEALACKVEATGGTRKKHRVRGDQNNPTNKRWNTRTERHTVNNCKWTGWRRCSCGVALPCGSSERMSRSRRRKADTAPEVDVSYTSCRPLLCVASIPSWGLFKSSSDPQDSWNSFVVGHISCSFFFFFFLFFFWTCIIQYSFKNIRNRKHLFFFSFFFARVPVCLSYFILISSESFQGFLRLITEILEFFQLTVWLDHQDPYIVLEDIGIFRSFIASKSSGDSLAISPRIILLFRSAGDSWPDHYKSLVQNLKDYSSFRRLF